jgi:hypothetical protein
MYSGSLPLSGVQKTPKDSKNGIVQELKFLKNCTDGS